ncbi:hypothetical protein IB267_18845 [Ensifer sp. ENS09]|uniref:hypothetical protein n=1 Tax=Ensifer sp. ENS09 TaxID=2769263 RepID=UPI001781899A|nr:hypothetical protein [Ensifer sp. ENS09]MBD9650400.1 hypothetical protein [Ensifer sp. ENS09]
MTEQIPVAGSRSKFTLGQLTSETHSQEGLPVVYDRRTVGYDHPFRGPNQNVSESFTRGAGLFSTSTACRRERTRSAGVQIGGRAIV